MASAPSAAGRGLIHMSAMPAMSILRGSITTILAPLSAIFITVCRRMPPEVWLGFVPQTTSSSGTCSSSGTAPWPKVKALAVWNGTPQNQPGVVTLGGSVTLILNLKPSGRVT